MSIILSEALEYGNGTSFHGETINTTPRKLMALADTLGLSYDASNTGEDKVNFDFAFRLKHSDHDFEFTVYDWKEYRPIGLDETIEFHIGAKSSQKACYAKYVLKTYLNKID